MGSDFVESIGGDAAQAVSQSADFGNDELSRQGMAAFAQGRYKDAIGNLKHALSQNGSNWNALCCLALCYCHDLRFKSARAAFEHLLQNCPDEQIKRRCAQALARLSEAEANGLIRLDAEAEPDTQELPVVKGASAVVDEQQHELAAPLEAEPAATPSDQADEQEKFRKWGVNCYLDDKYDRAIEYLEKGISAQVDDDNARFCLGMSYYKAGRYDDARRSLNQLLDKCTDNKMRGRIRQALDGIKLAEEEPLPMADIPASASPAPAGATRKADKKKGGKEAGEDRSMDDLRQSFPEGRRTNPLMYPVLVVAVIAAAYYAVQTQLADVYEAILVPASIQISSVQKFGALAGVEGSIESIPAAGGTKLYGVYYAAPKASRALIINPGITDDAAFRKKLAEAMLKAGVSVLVYDGHGTGASGGKVSWQTMANDGQFAFEYLVGKYGFDPPNVLCYGSDWGSASAVRMGCIAGGGAAVENPFCSVPSLVRSKMPALAIYPDALCPEPHIDLLQAAGPARDRQHAPLLVLVSQNTVVPPSESQAFYERAADPKQIERSGSQDSRLAAIVKFFNGN